MLIHHSRKVLTFFYVLFSDIHYYTVGVCLFLTLKFQLILYINDLMIRWLFHIAAIYSTYSPGADSENLDFVAPPEEHRFYGIFCFFGSPASILKTLPLSKCVRKTL